MLSYKIPAVFLSCSDGISGLRRAFLVIFITVINYKQRKWKTIQECYHVSSSNFVFFCTKLVIAISRETLG